MQKWWLGVLVIVGLVGGAVWLVRSDDTVVAAAPGRSDCDITGREGWPDTIQTQPTPAVGQEPPDQPADPSGMDRLNDPMNELEELITGQGYSDEAGYESFDWGPDYAGLVGDPVTKQAVLLLTEGSALDTDRFYELFPGGADDLRIEYVRYSYKQLDTWRVSLSEPLRALRLDEVRWGLNQTMNRIDITTTAPDSVNLTGVLPADAYCVIEVAGSDGEQPGHDEESLPLTRTVEDLDDRIRRLPPEIADLQGIDLVSVLSRGCLAWSFTPFRDHGAINDAVYSFLVSADDPSMFNGAVFEDPDVLDEAITDACEYRDDPVLAWAVLSNRLGVTAQEFSILVDAACENYARSQPYKSPQAGFDAFVLQVVGVGDLNDLIDQLCP